MYQRCGFLLLLIPLPLRFHRKSDTLFLLTRINRCLTLRIDSTGDWRWEKSQKIHKVHSELFQFCYPNVRVGCWRWQLTQRERWKRGLFGCSLKSLPESLDFLPPPSSKRTELDTWYGERGLHFRWKMDQRWTASLFRDNLWSFLHPRTQNRAWEVESKNPWKYRFRCCLMWVSSSLLDCWIPDWNAETLVYLKRKGIFRCVGWELDLKWRNCWPVIALFGYN